MSAKISKRVLREAAPASGEVAVEGVRCMGAVQVVFYITASDAVHIASSVEEVSMDGTVWQTSSAAMAMADASGTISGVPLSSGGAIRIMSPSSGANVIPWKYVRIKLTPDAGEEIGGLRVYGYVMY
jgi:hypothetical protein